MFVDFNQNAPHKTVFGAWCVRAGPGAQVSTPFAWDELAHIHPDELTMATVPTAARGAGDPWATIDDEPQSIEPLVERYERDLAAGIPDAPWPPVYPKMPDEAPRVDPSRARKPGGVAVSEAALREAEREAILEAAPFAVGVALALTALAVVSAQADWRLFDNVGWWLWAVTAGAWGLLALVLLMGLSTAVGRRDVRRRLVQTLLALAVLLSVVQTALLVASLVNASDVRVTGPQLLQSGATLWFSNVVAFGLAFWTMDAGGPVRRAVAQS